MRASLVNLLMGIVSLQYTTNVKIGLQIQCRVIMDNTFKQLKINEKLLTAELNCSFKTIILQWLNNKIGKYILTVITLLLEAKTKLSESRTPTYTGITYCFLTRDACKYAYKIVNYHSHTYIRTYIQYI